jgi:hypothetical protein
MLEQIEIQLAELKQAEEIEAQVRAMVASKRERLAVLLKEFASTRKLPEAVPNAEPIPVDRRERPYGAPGAPRDLLAESGAVAAKEVPSKGATVMLKPGALRSEAVPARSEAGPARNEAAKAPSAQQVFESLNRLVGSGLPGGKGSTLKN